LLLGNLMKSGATRPTKPGQKHAKDDEVQLATSDDSDCEDVAVSTIVDVAAAKRATAKENQKGKTTLKDGAREMAMVVRSATESEVGELIPYEDVAALAGDVDAGLAVGPKADEEDDVPQPDEEEEVTLQHSPSLLRLKSKGEGDGEGSQLSPKKLPPSPIELWLTRCLEKILDTKSLPQGSKREALEALNRFRSDADANAVYTAFAHAASEEWASVVKRTVAVAGEPPGGWKDAPKEEQAGEQQGPPDAREGGSDDEEDVPLRVKAEKRKQEKQKKSRKKTDGGAKKRKASAQEAKEDGSPLTTDKRVKRIVDSWANLKSLKAHRECSMPLREVRDTDDALRDLEGACAHAKLVSYVRKQQPAEKNARVQNIANMLYLMLATDTPEYSDVASVIQYTKNTKRELAQTHICLDILNKSADDKRSLEVVFNFHEAIAEFAKRF